MDRGNVKNCSHEAPARTIEKINHRIVQAGYELAPEAAETTRADSLLGKLLFAQEDESALAGLPRST
jgi:hypothetical protein